MTPIDVVAPTTPLLACSGPFSVPTVSVELNVLVPLHVLLVVVPKASVNVLSEDRSPPPCRGYVVLMFLVFGAGVNPNIDDEAAVFSVPLLPDV